MALRADPLHAGLCRSLRRSFHRAHDRPPRQWCFSPDPSAIKQIFTGDSRQFRAGQANRVFKAILGPNSLLLLDGSRHKRERKLLMPPFHGARVRLYGEMMWEITDRSIDSWPVGAAFPIHPFLKDITLEIILRVVFGVG